MMPELQRTYGAQLGRGWGFHVAEADLASNAGEAMSRNAFTQLAANDLVEAISSKASDTTQTLTLLGINTSGHRVMRSVKMNGCTAVTVADSMSLVETAFLDKKAGGAIRIRRSDQSTYIGSITIGEMSLPVAHHFSGKDHYMAVAQIVGHNTSGTRPISFRARFHPVATDVRVGSGQFVAAAVYMGATIGTAAVRFDPPMLFPPGGALVIYGVGGVGASTDGAVTVHGFDPKAGA